MYKKILSIILLSFLSAQAFASDGLKTINVFVKDAAGNIQTIPGKASITLDTTAPVINLLQNPDLTWSNTPKVVQAEIIETNLVSSKYAVINSQDTCGSGLTFKDYSSNTQLLFSNETYNGKKVCFEAKDHFFTTYKESNIIDNIDTIAPNSPNDIIAGQIAYNKIELKGTCGNEAGSYFIVKDNGVQIAKETLPNPCVYDYTYTLSNPPINHVITYYIEDRAGNQSIQKTFNAYVPVEGSAYLVTPGDNTTVGPVFSAVGYSSIANTVIKIKDLDSGNYIAEGKSDSLGNFVVQTTTSQSLGQKRIDLEYNGILANDIRHITIASNNLVVPTITNTGTLERLNTKLPTIEVHGEALTSIRVYAKDSNSNIIEIGNTTLSAAGNGTITSNVTLPGGENIIYVVDTIHKLSSNLVYIVVVDPYGYVYDSKTKQAISGAKIYITDCNGNNITLPSVNGISQNNPVVSNSSGYYDSYENPGTYCLKVIKDGYTFPSVIVGTGSNNLDGTTTSGAHGENFTVTSSPIHIDIPLDPVIKTISVSSGGGGSGGGSFLFYDYRNYPDSAVLNTNTSSGKISINISTGGVKTEDRTYNITFNGNQDSYNTYRFMYHIPKDFNNAQDFIVDYKHTINLSKSVYVSITDTRYNGDDLYIKYNENEDWQKFTNYTLNGKTISFLTSKGFLLKIDFGKFNNSVTLVSEVPVSEVKNIIQKYNVKFFSTDIEAQLTYSNNMNKKFAQNLAGISDDVFLNKLPNLFQKVESLKNVSEKNKLLYNYLAGLYNQRYGNYLKKLVVNQ